MTKNIFTVFNTDMNINSQNNVLSFRARFFNSESLRSVANYAAEHGKFEKLNNSRKNIEKYYFNRRLLVDIGEKEGKPYITFTRFVQKPEVIVPKTMLDFKQDKVVTIQSEKRMNPLKFAFEKLVKLGNEAPKNNMFKNIVINK